MVLLPMVPFNGHFAPSSYLYRGHHSLEYLIKTLLLSIPPVPTTSFQWVSIHPKGLFLSTSLLCWLPMIYLLISLISLSQTSAGKVLSLPPSAPQK